MRLLDVFDFPVRAYQEGQGQTPLLVVGPASLFMKPGMLPDKMRDIYTIHFVDIFSDSIQKTRGKIDQLTLDDYIKAIESVQVQLKLPMVSLFAHSAMGVLGYEYARKNPDKVSSLIMVATAPIWTTYKKTTSDLFFYANSTEKRKRLRERDEKRLSDSPSAGPRNQFINDYVSRRSQFFYDTNNPMASPKMWDGVNHNMRLVSRYFSLIQDYDLRTTSQVTVPIFLALGMYDSSIPFYSWTDDLSEKLKSIYYHIFDKSGHYPMMEEPECFVNELQAFIELNTSNYDSGNTQESEMVFFRS